MRGGDDVFLGDAAVLAGAFHRRGVDAIFQNGAAHGGRQHGGVCALCGLAGGYSHGGRRCGGGLGGRGGAGGGTRRARFFYRRDHRADHHRVTHGGQLRRQNAGSRGADIDGDLVGLQTDDRLIERNRFAGLFEPLANGGLGNRFTQGGNFDFLCHLAGLSG